MVAFYEEAFYLRNNPLPTSTSLVFKTTIKSRLGGGGGGGIGEEKAIKVERGREISM